MATALTPEGLTKLSVEERLKMIEMIWSSLIAEGAELPVPDWQLEIIHDRVAQFRADPGKGTDVDEFLDNLRRKP
jgi:putative addiction module component (TIGR02574 family)